MITSGDTATVTNTMLAGSIANAKLANSSVTINGSAVSLGGSLNVGTVTSVSGTGTASGLTLSGTVTSSGSLTLSGTVNSLAAGTYGISISGNAATATALSSGQSNWSGTGVLGNVVGLLAWKNYGNGHVIFDASNGTSPSGGAVNNTNAQVAWSGTYPTLMGWNGSSTYGVRVDSARVADNGGVTSVNGLTGAVTVSASAFPAGTVMLFRQTAAPTGWTKDTTNFNNNAIRVVTGTVSSGGSVDFSTAFASQAVSGSVSVNTSGLSAGATTLATTQIPSHTHSVPGSTFDNGSRILFFGNDGSGTASTSTSATGGGGSHTHSVSGSASSSAITLDVQYVDLIIASKN